MGSKYIENTTREIIFVGGKMIHPGEGRDIDLALLPPEHQDARAAPAEPTEPSLAELVGELLKGNVKAITAQLHTLKLEALGLALEMEGAAKTPRTSLLAAIQAEQINRSAAALDGGQTDAQKAFEEQVQAAYQAQLDTLSPDELAVIGEDSHAALREQAKLDVQAALDHQAEQAGQG